MSYQQLLHSIKRKALVYIDGITFNSEFPAKRRNAELALKKSEGLLNKVFDSTPVIMLLINEDARILKMNRFGYVTLNNSGKDVSGLGGGDLLSCINSYKDVRGCGYSYECKKCVLRNCIEDTFTLGKDCFNTEADLILLRDDQTRRNTFHVSASVISDEDVKTVLVTLDNITSDKEMEFELIRAKDKAEENENLKTAFLSNISHEIRTPMNSIMGFSELLMNPDLTEEKKFQYSSLVSDGCKQFLEVFTDLIYIAHLEAGQIAVSNSEVNIDDLFSEIYLSFINSANIKKLNLINAKSLAAGASVIIVDGEKVEKILSNLIANAIKFTHQGYIEFGYIFAGNNVEFFVKDTGIGISHDLQNSIFDHFRQAETTYTRTYGGIGLGLTISRALVEIMGGKIWLESEPGKGSVFYFRIPFKLTAQPISVLQKSIDENPVKEANVILVAEDNEINSYFLEQVLQKLNYSVCFAKDGYEAVQNIRMNRSIKLVLMDIKMPVMDGYEATRAIKELRRSVTVIAQTAYMETELTDKMKNCGFDGLITKPLDIEKLDRIIKSYM